MGDRLRHLLPTRLGCVHAVEAGPPGPPPIVLLHQTPRSVDEFGEVLPLLARTHHAIAIDTPGYGCSDAVAGQPTIADYAGAIVEVWDRLGIASAWVVGHHTGAVIGVELAAAFPERVAGLVLSGPVYLDAAGREALARHFVQWRVREDGAHLIEKWQKFLAWVPDPPLVQRLVVDLFRAGETSEQGHFAVAAYRMEERLPLVRCPGLLVYGTRDPFASRERAGPFRAVLHPSEEVVLDAGVFLPNEAPAAFADAVRTFIDRVRAGSHGT